MVGRFLDREEAGQRLSEKLGQYAHRHGALVLGLPRGGVPVAFVVAQRLGLPLDVFVVRKLGVPGFEELALGAIASGGVRVFNEDVVRAVPDVAEMLESIVAKELEELERRERLYRDGRASPALDGSIVILVDDGLATGATMRAAIAALQKCGVARIVVAVPVGAAETCRELEQEVDEIVCPVASESCSAVGD
jgi:predicted phosphoribosyltransferase